MARNLKAVMLVAGLMLALGPGWAFGGELEDQLGKTVVDLVIDDGTTATVGANGNAYVRYWDKIGADGLPADDATVGNVTMTGGSLTLGKDATSTGMLEVGRFTMTDGTLTVQGTKTGGSNWANNTSFLTGAWNGIDGDETKETASVSITGGTINLKNGGRIQTTWGAGNGTDGYDRMFYIGGDAEINLDGGVLKATDAYNRTGPEHAPDLGGSQMVIDGTAKITVSGANNSYILSRETTMSGGTITNTGAGKIIVTAPVKESLPDGTDPSTDIDDGLSDGSATMWGDFTMTGGTIDNSAEDAGAIDFVAGNLDLNATGGTIKTGTLNLDDAAATATNTIAAKNLNVTSGDLFTLDGNLDIAANGALSNKGTLNITGKTKSAKLLTLDAGSSTTFGGAVTSMGLTVDNGASATFNAASTVTGDLTVADGASATFNNGESTVTGNTTLGKESTLDIKKTGGLKTAGTLDLQSDTILKVEVDPENINAAGTLSAGKITLAGDDNIDAINDYLKDQSSSNLLSSTTFTIDENGNLTFAAVEQDPMKGMEDALVKIGAGDMMSGMTASATDSWTSIIKENMGGGSLSGQGLETYKLMDSVFMSGTASGEEARSIVSALAGFDFAKSIDIAMITANNVAGRIQTRVMDNNLARARADERFGSGDALASARMNSSFANRFWIGGFGLWENADQRGWDSGYEYKSGGFITGYDRVFGPITVGGSFAYTSGSYEDKNALSSDSNIDSYAFNLYGTYNHSSGLFATLMGGYTYSDYDMENLVTRAGQWNKADFRGNTWTIGGSLGYDIRPTQCLTITPSAGLYYYTSSTSTFRTTLSNNMKVERDSGELPLDLAVSYDIPAAGGNLRLTANTGYAYSFSKDGGELDAFGYNGIGNSRISGIKGRENARHTWNVGAGATYSAGRFDVGVKYDYYAKSDYDAHRVMGTVGIGF